jgi:predicted O-methyltransferase YrrM
MYTPLQLLFKYYHYYFTAANGKGHGTHSPFVYEFITKVLNNQQHYPAYTKIESMRKQLLRNKTVLTIQDFGAGSRTGLTKQRRVQQIAQSSLKPRKYSQLLFKIVNHYQPQQILELGTSLGITTAYMAAAAPQSKLITMEGASEVAAMAKQTFQQIEGAPITLVEGDFNHTLSHTLANLASVDLAFLDGNHQYQPTIHYFQQILEKCTENSMVVLDDIHWSVEMEQAWHTVQQHPQVTASIDLFFIGIVLFKKEFQQKQHFKIRY